MVERRNGARAELAELAELAKCPAAARRARRPSSAAQSPLKLKLELATGPKARRLDAAKTQVAPITASEECSRHSIGRREQVLEVLGARQTSCVVWEAHKARTKRRPRAMASSAPEAVCGQWAAIGQPLDAHWTPLEGRPVASGGPREP